MTSVVRPCISRVERGLHQRLALGIERRGRLVEQQQRRVAQDRARDRDALALAARQRDAALADRRVVALRQPADELVGERELGRRARPPRRVASGRPKRMFSRDRAGEHDGVLRHQRDARAQLRADRRRRRSTPSNAMRARRRIVEAQQQVEERALARAGRPDERDLLARPARGNDTPSSTLAVAAASDRRSARPRRRPRRAPATGSGTGCAGARDGRLDARISASRSAAPAACEISPQTWLSSPSAPAANTA